MELCTHNVLEKTTLNVSLAYTSAAQSPYNRRVLQYRKLEESPQINDLALFVLTDEVVHHTTRATCILYSIT
jgi:hypothetical protein